LYFEKYGTVRNLI